MTRELRDAGRTVSTRQRTAEMVSYGHPDKFCDQLADAILDAALSQDAMSRVAIEALAKSSRVVISGELTTGATLDMTAIAREVWESVGYGPGSELEVVNLVAEQEPEIANVVSADTKDPGAGDQGIMVGYATDETESMMPREYELARALALRLKDLRTADPRFRSDAKTQVTTAGDRVESVILATQHVPELTRPELEETLLREIVLPVIGYRPQRLVVNGGAGVFTVGGPQADAGVVGRKIVVDAYGPRVPVGGGAYSGKDPSKVDRSAAYMARHVAKQVVAHRIGGARECVVGLAFGIGQHEPEMVTAFTETGRDVSDWVLSHFGELSPASIIDYLGLRRCEGWSYRSTAAYGHYGRDGFPWEAIVDV